MLTGFLNVIIIIVKPQHLIKRCKLLTIHMSCENLKFINIFKSKVNINMNKVYTKLLK